MARLWLLLAGFAGLSGVALGAFAAHGLKGRLGSEALAVFQTGVLYHLLHAVVLFGVALLALRLRSRLVTLAGTFFTLGILLFSGSLYLMMLTPVGKLGLITPAGGVCFMIGWLCLALTALRVEKAPRAIRHTSDQPTWLT